MLKVQNWNFVQIGENYHLIGDDIAHLDGIVSSPVTKIAISEKIIVDTFDEEIYVLDGETGHSADAEYLLRHFIKSWNWDGPVIYSHDVNKIASLI